MNDSYDKPLSRREPKFLMIGRLMKMVQRKKRVTMMSCCWELTPLVFPAVQEWLSWTAQASGSVKSNGASALMHQQLIYSCFG